MAYRLSLRGRRSNETPVWERRVRFLWPVTRLLAFLGLILAVAEVSTADEPTPLDRVLAEPPEDMMLGSFRAQADRLPPARELPQTKEAWEKRRVELRRQLWQSLGEFPLEVRPPLQPRITGRVDHGDHVVEKVVYQSLPGLYVTALVYVPKNLKAPAPAVICVNGHWAEAKATPDIQRRCAGLARMGVIAFCQDVIGTGERAAAADMPHPTYHGNYRGAAARVVDRSLLGYIMYECMRALDYLETRRDVDAKRIFCTGASGGGKQSMFFAALDDRLAGAVPVCYVSSYRAHMGATACVGEIPTHVLRYTDQWEILGLHAPRPLLGIAASQDIPVFQPRLLFETLAKTKHNVYRLYGKEHLVRGAEFDSPHAYNRPMRELLYAHVAEHLLGSPDAEIVEDEDLPVESAETLRCGLPPESETLQSLTFRRAKELVRQITAPSDSESWKRQRKQMLAQLEREVFGGFPESLDVPKRRVGQYVSDGRRYEHWILETEPGVLVPAVLVQPREFQTPERRPAVLVVDEAGKQHAFERGLIDALADAGNVVLALDVRGTGETAGTVPQYRGAQDYNLSNYSLFLGRPLTGMRVHDVRCAVELLGKQNDVDASQIAVVGRGIGGLVGMLAAAYEERIAVVATEEMLATWVFEEEFAEIGLSYLIPRILTLGDMPHWAACVAPRPLLILNPVDGRRRPVAPEAENSGWKFTETVYKRDGQHGVFEQRRLAENDVSRFVVDWLSDQLGR